METWKIDVRWKTDTEKDRFEVTINDSTVIDTGPKVFKNELEETGQYRGRSVRLRVRRSTVYLGENFEALVYVDKELAAATKF